jgi:site-specific recombinase XerD
MATIPEIAVSETSLIVDTRLLSEFEGDCKDRHLTDETIGRYKSPLKLFLAFLKERNQTIQTVDKHVLKDFIHYRRGQGVDQKTLENNFSALSTFYEFL